MYSLYDQITIDKNTGRVGIGTTMPLCVFDASQRTDGILIPAGIDNQRPTNPINGMLRLNLTEKHLQFYRGAWQDHINTIPTLLSTSSYLINTSITITGANFEPTQEWEFIGSNAARHYPIISYLSTSQILLNKPPTFTDGLYTLKVHSQLSGLDLIHPTQFTYQKDALAGGSYIDVGLYRVRTFSTSYTLNVGFTTLIDFLLIAGGGGGGNTGGDTGRRAGGGGGAGGYIYRSNVLLEPGTYTITIGAGGTSDTSGNDSVFGNYTAIGGGRGQGEFVYYLYGWQYNIGLSPAENGGSGGGLHHGGGTPGTGLSGQGFGGGPTAYDDYDLGKRAGSGGGGGGEQGKNATSSSGGAGGIGISYSFTGTAEYYCGGGGGASSQQYVGSAYYIGPGA